MTKWRGENSSAWYLRSRLISEMAEESEISALGWLKYQRASK
jgi:hypothetical protein